MSDKLPAIERMALAGDFVRAVAAGSWPLAQQIWPQLHGVLSREVLQAAVAMHMRHEEWSQAAGVLELFNPPDDQSRAQSNFCKNVDCLKQHRRDIYRQVINSSAGPYVIHTMGDGAQTIAVDRDSRRTLLGGGPGGGRKIAADLATSVTRGEPFALVGIGDGAALNELVRRAPTFALGRRQAIYLFEPDVELLFATLLINDFTGVAGPIQSPNVQWFVGRRWKEQFRLTALTDAYLPFPKVMVRLAVNPTPIDQGIMGVLNEIGRADTRHLTKINGYYEALPADHFANVFGPSTTRPPRVLLITTRFSTVLQHSTADAASAFRDIGCEAKVIIEPTSHHSVTRIAIRTALAEFKPDMVFQIDHNRFEHGDLFPSRLPFVNWIQDLLDHLMRPEVGPKLTRNDFVLAPAVARWSDEFAYPERQCMEFRKLTRVPVRPIGRCTAGDRVVYVSNWSQSPGRMRDELLKATPVEDQDVLADACDRMIDCYSKGQTLYTPGDCRRLLEQTLAKRTKAVDPVRVGTVAGRLFDRMNNLLYRQQGLRFAAAAVAKAGLTLEIYGSGWESNGEFARYARGQIEYGRPLEELTRQAAINLVLEPFVCISHQRLLDAIVAGGFCIIRQHPSNLLLGELVAALAGLPPEESVDTRTAERVLIAGGREAELATLRDLLRRCAAIEATPGATDFVAATRSQQATGFLPTCGTILPHLHAVTFATGEEAAALMTRFTRDPAAGREISRRQLRHIESNYSYSAGLRRVLKFLHGRLTEQSVAERIAA